MTVKMIRLSDYLHVGRENATPTSDLAFMLKCAPRDIQLAAERERRAGAPICATNEGRGGGLYLAKNGAEMADYCKRLHHRTGEITETLRACEQTAARMIAGEMALDR